MSIISAAVTLLLVIDPIGNIPAFMALLASVDSARRKWVIARECLIALAVLVVFLFAGPLILGLFEITDEAFRIAGGVIIFLIALRMIFRPPSRIFEDDPVEGEPFVVPLAVPFVAGPSAIAVVVVLATQQPGRRLDWLVALLLAWVVTLLTLLAGSFLQKHLGQRALIAAQRLMGMLLTVIAVQMFIDGLRAITTATEAV
jgi:MarC family membrane protein